MRRNFCIALVLGALCCGASRADIVFIEGVSNTGTDNVLFNELTDIIGPAPTVQGHIHNLGSNVSVTSDENLIVNNSGGGQATISAVTSGFTVAEIYLTNPPGGTYGKIVFALSGFGTGQASRVPFTIFVTEGDGSTDSQSFTTGGGDTFYTVIALNGQDIRNVRLQTMDGSQFDTLKQLRIGPAEAAVPDGGVTAMLLGAALVGLETLRRRFRA